MKILVTDFDDYKLIAIHTKLEDYQLAYSINKVSGIKLTRQKKSLKFKNNKVCFSVFEHYDEQTLFQHHLIQNKVFNMTEDQNRTHLFRDFLLKKICLIEEKDEVDFFLRIEDGSEKHLSELTESLNSFGNVIFAQSIKISQLKSKDHLIF